MQTISKSSKIVCLTNEFKQSSKYFSTLKQGIRSKLIASFLALGLSAPAAFVAYDLTLSSEGFSQSVYTDPVGLPTVCAGHMDKALKKGQFFSIEECMAMFAVDWKKHQVQLDSVVKVPYKSEWQREALTDFTFNVGIGSVKSSTLLSLLNQNKHTEACRQLTRWVKGKVKGRAITLKGLVTRRDKTMPYCLGELSWDKQQEFKQFEAEYEALKRQR